MVSPANIRTMPEKDIRVKFSSSRNIPRIDAVTGSASVRVYAVATGTLNIPFAKDE